MSCLICRQNLDKNNTVEVNWKGLQGLIRFSRLREDNLEDVFRSVETITLHSECRRRYTKGTVNDKGKLRLSTLPHQNLRDCKQGAETQDLSYIDENGSEPIADASKVESIVEVKIENLLDNMPHQNLRDCKQGAETQDLSHIDENYSEPIADASKIESIFEVKIENLLDNNVQAEYEPETKTAAPKIFAEEKNYQQFSFEHKCLFCTKSIEKEKPKKEFKKLKGKKNIVYRVTSGEMQNQLIETLEKIKKPKYQKVLQRIRGVDLVASKAGYHKKCYVMNMSEDNESKNPVGRPPRPEVAVAMEDIFMYMEESNSTEFSMAELKSAVKGFRPCNRTIKTKLKEKYGDRLNIIVDGCYVFITLRNDSSSKTEARSLRSHHTDTYDEDRDYSDDLPLQEEKNRTKKKKRVKNKREEEQNKITLFCSVCLSSDRKLDGLGDFEEIYYKVCADIAYPTDDSKAKLLLLCWECKALLKNVKRFRMKAQASQKILSHVKNGPLNTLTTLATSFPADSIVSCEPNEVTKLEFELPAESTFVKEEQEIQEFSNVMQYLEINVNKDEEAQESTTVDHGYDTFDRFDKSDNDSDKKPKIIKKKKVKKSGKQKKSDAKSQTKMATFSSEKLDENIHYKAIVQDFNANDKIIREPIERQDLSHWLDKERDSLYFKLLSNKCEKCVCKVPEGEDHVNLYHSIKNPYVCPVCARTFASETEEQIHLTEHYYILSCAICGYRCYNEYHIKDHLERHRNVLQCLECEGILRNEFALKEHYKNVHRDCICDYCGKRFAHKLTIAVHIQSKHTMEHVCTICKRIYKTRNSLLSHKKTRHNIDRSEAAYCVQCDRQFDNVNLYKKHVYGSKYHRHERIRPIPSKIKKKARFPCPQCPKEYNYRYTLKGHFDLVHANQTNFVCHYCSKTFPTVHNLKAHLRIHEGYKAPKNKFCDICGRGFAENKVLQNHIRTHTGERPYKCPHCDAAFAQKAAMRTHVKRHMRKQDKHPDMLEAETPAGSTTNLKFMF